MATENEELEDLELEEEQSEEEEQEEDSSEDEDSNGDESDTDDSDDDDSADDDEDDSVTLTGKDKEAYDKYLQKKQQRQKFADKAAKKDGKQTKTDLPIADNTDSIIAAVTALKGLDDTEISKMEKEAKALGIPLVKYVKSNSGKTMLDTIRTSAKKKEASSTVTSKAPVYKKHTQEDLNNMTAAQLEKILPKA